MKSRAVSLILVLSLLLFSAAAGLSGCGGGNTLTSITVLPAVPVLAKDTRLQLAVIATFSDGMTVPSWSQITWNSSAPTVASVNSSGLVYGLVVGTAVITATDIGHPDLTSSVTVYVTELTSITIDPPVASIGTGTTQQFTATGHYTALTPSAWSATWPPDITASVLWTSSSTTVAVIGNTFGSHGLATAVSAGTTTITATDLATGLTGTAIAGSAGLMVF